MTKYDFDLSDEVIKRDLKRLINQVWKIIPMCENGEDWHKQIETVLTELVGLNEVFMQKDQFLQSISKLEGIFLRDVEFSFLRKSVFEIITLLQELNNGIKEI